MLVRRLARIGVVCLAFYCSPAIAASQQPSAVIQMVVTADDRPVPRAQIIVGGNTTETDAEGRAMLQLPAGAVEIDVGGLGLLQIPPTDLGQVEVIKGVASALYGGALGGVVDLISRRPTKEPIREALVNRTTRGGTDATFFAAQPWNERWSGTMLVGGHWQERNDIDEDGWADLAGYSRAVVRPRVFWNDGAGRSLFVTGGAMWEQRRAGTIPGAVLSPTGAPYPESLDTTRLDGGLIAQTPVGRPTRALCISVGECPDMSSPIICGVRCCLWP